MRLRLSPVDAVSGAAEPPPSKSYAHRAMFLALLAGGRSRLAPLPVGDDVEATASVVGLLGARVGKAGGALTVDSEWPRWSPLLHCRESGTTLRIAMGVASLLDQPVLLHGSGRLPYRPVRGLARALEALGAGVLLSRGCCPPVAVRGPINGGRVAVDAGESSQYLTALLVAGSAVEAGLEIAVERLSSRGYVDVTCRVLGWFGVRVEREGYSWFRVEGPPKPAAVTLPGDWSSAIPLLAIAAGGLGRVEVRGLDPGDPHPDRRAAGVLAEAGARVVALRDGVRVEAWEPPRPFTACVDDYPDAAPALAALAAAACGVSRLCRASRLRIKESDRFSSVIALLREAGVAAWAEGDCIVVRGVCDRRLPIQRLNPPPDHRMVMAAAVLGLLVSSTPFTVSNADAVSKSFPGFWNALAGLGVAVEKA